MTTTSTGSNAGKCVETTINKFCSTTRRRRARRTARGEGRLERKHRNLETHVVRERYTHVINTRLTSSLERLHGSRWQRRNLCENACGIKDPPQAFHSNRLCVTQEECLGSHYFHRGQTTTGRLSPNTNTEEGTLTQESGDVRSVEGEVCGAVLVDE